MENGWFTPLPFGTPARPVDLDHPGRSSKLTSGRVLVGFTVGDGVPIYLGSFCEYDLAGIIKDSAVLPCAFACVNNGVGRQKFREIVIDKFDELDALPKPFTKLKNSIDELKTPL